MHTEKQKLRKKSHTQKKMYPISVLNENRNRLWHYTRAVRSHRGTLYGELSRFFTRVYKNSNTHTHTQMRSNTHTCMQRKRSCLQPPLSLCPQASTVLSTVPTGTALHLLLSHRHNKRKAVRNTKPETLREEGWSTETEWEIKQDRGTERSKKL